MPEISVPWKAAVPPQSSGTAGGSRGPETPAGALTDLERKSAEAQAVVREILTKLGIGDRDVLKTYNVERGGRDAKWVEATLELAPKRPIHSGKVLKSL